MNIIGIVGKKNSDKATVENHLVSEYGYVKVALADQIKRFGREVFDFTDTQLWGPSSCRNKIDKRFDYYCYVLDRCCCEIQVIVVNICEIITQVN